MTSETTINDLLAEAEREVGRFTWEGTFADYLRMVTEDASLSRLSHKLVYDAVVAGGVEEAPTGEPVYSPFAGEIFGVDAALNRIAQYLASSARKLETRKRMLLLGPPASGKSTIVALIKQALERHTRTDEGAVYGIKVCPMQEEPLHLIPHQLRQRLLDSHGIYIEGDLCPRCRYVLHTKHNGKVSEMEVQRVTFSDHQAVGIGYYVASNPNPTDASLLVGSIDTAQLEGDRLEVAGKAFRLDGEFNVANRGMIELVEIFKADPHLLTTLLGLAQEQLIKMERFGSVYADEVIVGHSNEGDYEAFKTDKRSEALKDRIIEVRIPYNLRVRDEVKIYEKMLRSSGLDEEDPAKHIGFVKDTVEDYGQRAVREVQRAFEERFDQTAAELLSEYLDNVQSYCSGSADRSVNERGMREMEKHIRISDRERDTFRREIHQFFTNLRNRDVSFDYTSEPRMKAAIEARLFPDRRKVERALSRPRLARRQAEWARRRGAVFNRLFNLYGHCPQCADDTIEYVVHVLKGNAVLKSPRDEGIEWQWDLNPSPPPAVAAE